MANHDFREMELWEHLAELRTRIIRTAVYVAVGAIAVWWCYPWVWDLLWGPLRPILARTGEEGPAAFTIMEPFFVKLQISIVGGLIVAVPFITSELWGFIAPGLTRSERKGFYIVGPLTVFFFFVGLTTGYLILPLAFNYFASFLLEGHWKLYPQASPYVLFLVKMCLAFGIVFELPVVLMFLGWVGIINSKLMIAYWRHAVVGCAAIGAVAVPSNDAPSMLMMVLPLIGLYFLSIALVRFVERIRGRRAAAHWESSGDSAATRALSESSAVATPAAPDTYDDTADMGPED